MEIPCVLCLNMADEARARGIRVSAKALEAEIGVPVVKTVATRRRGVTRLRRAIPEAAVCRTRVNYGHEVEEAVRQVEGRLDGSSRGRRGLALLFLSGDRTLAGPLRGRVGEEDLRAAEEVRFGLSAETTEPVAATVQRLRYSRAQAIAARVTRHAHRRRPSGRLRLAERFGDWALHPLWGKLILAGALLAMFWLVGLLGAGVLVDFLETAVFGEALVPGAIAVTDLVLPFPHEHARETLSWELTVPLTPAHEVPTGIGLAREVRVPAYELTGELGPGGHVIRFVHDLLVGEFGLLTMGLPYALAIVLPIVTVFFFVLGILEDSGYLPRLAVVVNRAFRAIGLNGKAVLPMVLGLGCVTMATLTARILETRRQRLLTVFLLALGIPCSAQLGVVLGLLATVSPAAVAVWAGLLLLVLLAVGWLAARVVPGEDSPLVLEIPPIRLPSLSNLTMKCVARVEWYLREAVPLFLLGTLVLFLADRTGVMQWLERLFAPLVTGLLGLPQVATTAFLVGFLRRDYGAVFLMDAARDGLLDPGQVLVAALVVTLFVPCIATVFLIGREWGWKTAGAVVAVVFALAFLIGGAVHGILAWTGWSP
jgi:ferrous iron transport protein B